MSRVCYEIPWHTGHSDIQTTRQPDLQTNRYTDIVTNCRGPLVLRMITPEAFDTDRVSNSPLELWSSTHSSKGEGSHLQWSYSKLKPRLDLPTFDSFEYLLTKEGYSLALAEKPFAQLHLHNHCSHNLAKIRIIILVSLEEKSILLCISKKGREGWLKVSLFK